MLFALVAAPGCRRSPRAARPEARRVVVVREIPGDTRGYDEIRSPHDVFTTTSVKRETANRTGKGFALRPAVICRDLLSARFP